MRVAHVITRLILGGAQENTLLTVEDQHRDWGDEVSLITGPGLGPEGSLIARAEAGGYDLRIIPELRRNLHPLRDWMSYRALVHQLRDLQPNIIHTHSSKAGILGRAAAARLKIPAVHTIHGPSFHPYQSRAAYLVYRGMERWAAARSARIVSVCDAMTEQYVAAGVAPRDRFQTVYSGMEVEPFLNPPRARETVRRELGVGPNDVVVGKVARLFHLKGHADVIEAATRLANEFPQVKFLFVGDGLLRAELEEQIQKAGLRERFVFTGLVPPTQVPELIHAMDLIVHTSLREGLARVLPQGLIAGKPVVSYDIDGAKEVVLPNETGFLLPPRDIDGLTNAIRILVTDPDLRMRLGQQGRHRFTEQFRHENMTRQLREIYTEILNDAR